MEGGVGAFTKALAQALAAVGHQIHIITSRQARPSTEKRRLSNLAEPFDTGFAQLHPHVRNWRWPSLSQVTDIVLRNDLDIVNIQYQAAAYHMRSPAANFLPWRLKGIAPTVVTFHDLLFPYLFPKAGPLRQAAVFFMARQAQGVIATNTADYQVLKDKLGQDIPLAQIPIGSNIPSFKPGPAAVSAIRQQLNLKPTDCLLGYFGFLHPSKGADILINVLAQREQNNHLVFIGGQTGSSDPENQAFYQRMRQLIDGEGLAGRVHWTGFVSDEEVSAYLHAADLMVMPYRDGASLRRGSLMAALAHGRPLITTTPTTPTSELVHGQNVYLVPPGDANALNAAVDVLSADPAIRNQLGQGAEETAALFTWDKIAEKTLIYLSSR